LHLASQRFAQGLAKPSRPINVPPIARDEQRGKKWEPLNVIPMRVAYEDRSA
jgi:hypothetical protein